jgi:hypothetical protein
MLPSGVYSSGYVVAAGLCVRLYALDSSAYEENVFGRDGGGFDDEEMNESMDASLDDDDAFDARAPSPLSLLDGSFGGTAMLRWTRGGGGLYAGRGGGGGGRAGTTGVDARVPSNAGPVLHAGAGSGSGVVVGGFASATGSGGGAGGGR